MTTSSAPIVHVAGDPTVDWWLMNPTGDHLQISYQWEAQATVRIVAMPGGAAFLTRLLRRLLRQRSGEVPADVYGIDLPESVVLDPRNRSVTRSFALWDLYPTEAGGVRRTWRVREFVGQEHAEEPAPFTSNPPPQAPATLVLDDTNLGFRDSPAAWPPSLSGDAPLPEHVILRMTNPLANGPLWEMLARTCPERLTVYLSVDDLRKEYAAVGQPLSWERTSSEVVRAVRERAELAPAARVIVSLGVSGAVIVTPGGGSTLVFDPANQQGDWERRHPGDSPGLGMCIVASLAHESLCREQMPDWGDAVQRGLQAARLVHQHGYELVGERGDAGKGFPAELVLPTLSRELPVEAFRTVAVPPVEQWDMVEGAFPQGYAAAARRIVVEGEEEACRNLPIERMGGWSTMDRTEIESIRSVRGIMREYVQRARRGRPLSIAVFGPPGSGKSFAIKQMAREWGVGAAEMSVLEFNLSQYGSLDELPRAFQRVRDCAVEGVLPLVFWDEFDTALGGRELGWLASFLAPMQDGVFSEGGTSRPIGPAIFVFAGGTHSTMASFKARATELPGAKATDFLSRLRGFVDILGPNPNDPGDRTFMLRRAFLLRTLLRQRAPQLFTGARPNVDPGILRAFLEIDAYVHGTRSMESLLDMSTLSGRLRYERSALPARHQLSLHVDPEKFLSLVQQEAAV